MKRWSSIVVAAAVLFTTNISHSYPFNSEANLTEHQVVRDVPVAEPEPLPTYFPQTQSEAAPALQLVLLDHEGDSAEVFESEEWSAAIAELKTDWDLTGMLDIPTQAGPQRRYLVADEDESLLSSTSAEATGSSTSASAISVMAIKGYEDR